MAILKFSPLHVPDRTLAQMFERISNVLSELSDKAILDGALLSGKVLTTGSANNIPHKLGRKLVGYLIVRRSADCRIWDDQLTSTREDLLVLQTSADVTVDIWVF